jgi:hypothetical protein
VAGEARLRMRMDFDAAGRAGPYSEMYLLQARAYA